MYPERDIKWLFDIAVNVWGQASPSKRKRDRIVPAEELLKFGSELMRMDGCQDTMSSSIAFRDDLMIAMLSARPIRRRNLQMNIGLKGTMGALYPRDLADKARRGLEGRIHAGRCTGSPLYGYALVSGGPTLKAWRWHALL
jgi:hypothetical protein